LVICAYFTRRTIALILMILMLLVLIIVIFVIFDQNYFITTLRIRMVVITIVWIILNYLRTIIIIQYKVVIKV